MPYYLPRGWLERVDQSTNDDTAVSGPFHLRRNCSRIENRELLVRVELPWSVQRCSVCAGDLDTLSGPIQRQEIPGRIVFVVGLAMILGCVALLIILGIGY